MVRGTKNWGRRGRGGNNVNTVYSCTKSSNRLKKKQESKTSPQINSCNFPKVKCWLQCFISKLEYKQFHHKHDSWRLWSIINKLCFSKPTYLILNEAGPRGTLQIITISIPTKWGWRNKNIYINFQLWWGCNPRPWICWAGATALPIKCARTHTHTSLCAYASQWVLQGFRMVWRKDTVRFD